MPSLACTHRFKTCDKNSLWNLAVRNRPMEGTRHRRPSKEPPPVETEDMGGAELLEPDKVSPLHCNIVDANDQKAAVHHQACFTIEACDGSGRRLSDGGESFFVAVRGPARVRCRVTDNHDGTYLCQRTPTLSGWYHLTVSSFGISLPRSPLTYEATTSQPYSANCIVSGAGLASAVAHTVVSSMIHEFLTDSCHGFLH